MLNNYTVEMKYQAKLSGKIAKKYFVKFLTLFLCESSLLWQYGFKQIIENYTMFNKMFVKLLTSNHYYVSATVVNLRYFCLPNAN